MSVKEKGKFERVLWVSPVKGGSVTRKSSNKKESSVSVTPYTGQMSLVRPNHSEITTSVLIFLLVMGEFPVVVYKPLTALMKIYLAHSETVV